MMFSTRQNKQKTKENIRFKPKFPLAEQVIAAGNNLDEDLETDIAPEIEPERMRTMDRVCEAGSPHREGG